MIARESIICMMTIILCMMWKIIMYYSIIYEMDYMTYY